MSVFVIKFIVWMLVVYGMTQIIVESYIFENVRRVLLKNIPPIGVGIQCMLCTGVWVSFLMSIFLWSPTYQLFTPDTDASYVIIKYIFCDGMLGATVVWYMHLIEHKIVN